jgi:hypothetical protein
VRRVVLAGEISLLVVAATVVTVAFVRTGARERRQPAGLELSTDFGAKFPMTQAGREDKASRSLTLGDGPDEISVVALGRKPRLQQGDIVYGPPEDAPAGRTVIDTNIEGDGLVFSAKVDTQAAKRARLEPLLEIFRGPRPDARSAIMLVGDPGRYVALIISGTGDEPRLEWALGTEHRGSMTAPMSMSPGTQMVALKVDPVTGALAAFIGKDKDQRLLAGNVLLLGPKWKQEFGETLRAALGCLEGTCAFHSVQVQGLKAPAPPAPPPTPPVAEVERRPPVQVSQASTVHNPPPATHPHPQPHEQPRAPERKPQQQPPPHKR